jgi:hypothetical protein
MGMTVLPLTEVNTIELDMPLENVQPGAVMDKYKYGSSFPATFAELLCIASHSPILFRLRHLSISQQQPQSSSMSRILLAVVLATYAARVSAQGATWNPGGRTSCFENEFCDDSDARQACSKAIDRWVENGMYKQSSTYVGGAGDIKCYAQFTCNSGGSQLEIQGSEVKKAFVDPVDSQSLDFADIPMIGFRLCTANAAPVVITYCPATAGCASLAAQMTRLVAIEGGPIKPSKPRSQHPRLPLPRSRRRHPPRPSRPRRPVLP